MKINRLSLRNFKGFDQRSFDFHPSVNVLIGDNGTGKSSVLDAAAFMLGTFFIGVDGIPTYALKNRDKRRLMVDRNSLETQLPLSLEIEHEIDGETLAWHRDTNRASGNSTTYASARELVRKARELTQAVRDGDRADLPLIAYYGTERLSEEKKSRKSGNKKNDGGSRLEGYRDALDPRAMKERFMAWFRDAETARLQDLQDETQSQDLLLYQAFVAVLGATLPDWENIHYNFKRKDIVGKAGDEWKEFESLSAGYKSMVRLCADIAYRAIRLNPHLGAEAVTATKGVVLVDEIDMHLHPKWQRVVVDRLQTAFPNIQFLLTTHSPFIVQSLKADELINLDDNRIDDDPDSRTLEDNALFMGVESAHSAEFEEKRQVSYDFFKLLEGEDSPENRAQIDLLIERTTDPVFRAKLEIERLIKFGKA
ncbi:ATP-binding protein (plasmid) [Fulvitalea axinellae]|uniref:ATP-binding protein n=1 Tax=Fulvitalea axinellae TaxID=1182444 RepID=A0AAU9CM49_9BACT|nr:ATP-binding protein [Fulvitalea axinellae]